MNKIQLRTILFAVLLSVFTGAAQDASAKDCTQKFLGAWMAIPGDGVPLLIEPDHTVKDSMGRASNVHMQWFCNGNVFRTKVGDIGAVMTLSADGNRMDGFSILTGETVTMIRVGKLPSVKKQKPGSMPRTTSGPFLKKPVCPKGTVSVQGVRTYNSGPNAGKKVPVWYCNKKP